MQKKLQKSINRQDMSDQTIHKGSCVYVVRTGRIGYNIEKITIIFWERDVVGRKEEDYTAS